jgi:ABC-2 type transport system ATP-binding protein
MPNMGNSRQASKEPATRSQQDGSNGAGETVLSATGIEKRYESRLPVVGRTVEVLDGANIDIQAGEIVGIVGANGSGKSTLMKILVGALEADAGTVTHEGAVGWCPQETLLYDRLTVAETFDLFGSAYGMSETETDAARQRLAEKLDFEEFLDYQVRHLSGGNRQKVNLGVALMHDPDVLLLDEPYTGFDWETYLSFWELTEELTADGTAIAIISHFVSERERFDRLFELRDGTLTEQRVEGDTATVDAETSADGTDPRATAPDPNAEGM